MPRKCKIMTCLTCGRKFKTKGYSKRYCGDRKKNGTCAWKKENEIKMRYQKRVRALTCHGIPVKTRQCKLCGQEFTTKCNTKFYCGDMKDNTSCAWLINTINHRWHGINDRCNRPDCDSAKWYYNKGIKNNITQEELLYLWDRDNANSMDRPTIDRINSDENYSIDNCRWIEWAENATRAGAVTPSTWRIVNERKKREKSNGM